MALFTPSIIFSRVTMISPKFIKNQGIKALMLDVDNTLTGHGSHKLDKDISAWLEEMKNAGIKLMIVSNNKRKRVEPFANTIGLDFTYFSLKPSPFGFIKACKKMGVNKSEVALVGDQIFTDALGANIFGCKVFLVEPIENVEIPTIMLKRYLEKPIIRYYYKKGGKKIESREDI